jgi:hypothetical protein
LTKLIQIASEFQPINLYDQEQLPFL